MHTLDQEHAARIWLGTEKTDMRCGFDRLAERVKTVVGRIRSVGICLCFAHGAGID